jgi:hypothetical protein
VTFTLTQPPETDSNYQVLMGLVGTLKGLTNWSAPIDHIAFDSDSRFAHVTRNLGTGGHQEWKKSTDNSQVAAVTDAGLGVTGAITGTSLAVNTSVTAGTSVHAGTAVIAGTSVSVGTTLNVTGTSTLAAVNAGATSVSTLQSSGAATLDSLGVTNSAVIGGNMQASMLISTVATGTAPIQVASTTAVGNLNADLLDGLDSTAFSLAAHHHDASYVNTTGDTMTGQLTLEISGGNDQAIKLKHNSGAGGFWIGASNAADPVLVFKDNGGDQTVTIGNSSSTHQLDVTGDGRVTDDLTVGGEIVADGLTVNTTGIHVDGSSDFDDGVTFGNGINVTSGSSLFGDSVTLGASLADIIRFSGSTVFDDTSGSGITYGASSNGRIKTYDGSLNPISIPYVNGH